MSPAQPTPVVVAGKPNAFRLTALQHPLVSAVLNEHEATLIELCQGLGSPLHVVMPQVFRQNVEDLRRAFADSGAQGRILFAKKANKAAVFAQTCADLGIGIDVASLAELSHALAGGVGGRNIGVSGPEKSEQLLTVALRHDCLIAVDSVTELSRLTTLAEHLRCRARILLRCQIDSQPDSRFGLPPHDLDHAVGFCAGHTEHVELRGFSFHLNGYSIRERAEAADRMIDHCVDAQSRGMKSCATVNIGGGLPVRYVAPTAWNDFLATDSRDHYHARKVFDGFYPYGTDTAGDHALRQILSHRVDQAGPTLAARAGAHNIEFIIEPGRALLSQAGFTVFTVQATKPSRTGDYAIITVAGSSFSLSEQWFNSEYLPDPLLLPTDRSAGAGQLACVGGATCLESDMVSWRKIALPRPASASDFLVYLNTAGYQMDSNESPFHDAEIPLKVAVEIDDRGQRLHWRLDK